MGVAPPQQSEADVVKAQFAKIYPNLAKLADVDPEKLEQLFAKSAALEEQNNHYWSSYAQNRMGELFSLAEETLGTQLNDEARSYLHANFIGYVQSSPEAYQRYQGDPNFVKDYWKAYTSNFVDPVRRTSVAAVPQRAQVPVPQDTPSGAVRTGAPAPKPANLDDRVARAWTAFNQAKVGNQ